MSQMLCQISWQAFGKISNCDFIVSFFLAFFCSDVLFSVGKPMHRYRTRHNNSYIYVPRIVFISNFVSGCVFTSFYKGDYKGAPENHLLIWKPNKRKQIVHFKVKIDISLIFMLFNFLVRTLHSTERLLFSRNRNLMGSANLLSIYSLVTT